MNARIDDLNRLYDVLHAAEERFGIWDYNKFEENKAELPDAGVYFFFEPGELRSNVADWHRVVRVGTHRVGNGSNSLFADRLRNHFGSSGTGIGRGSVFRDHIGSAIFGPAGWNEHDEAVSPQRHEMVSAYIRSMWFIPIPVNDIAGPESARRKIELDTIGMLSNYGKPEDDWIDPPSSHWLGRRSQSAAAPHDHVSKSGLWNVDGVSRAYDRTVLDFMKHWIAA